MRGLRRNVFANLTGQLFVAVIQIAMIPVYVRYLGVEAYGLVGVYLSVQAFAQLLDFGMSPAVNRQMARLAVLSTDPASARDFVRTSEAIYLSIGGLLGAVLFLAAPVAATRWFQDVSMPAPLVVRGLRMIAMLVAAQWSLTFYQGALLGLNRHVELNIVRACGAALAAAGAVVVLARVSPTADAFFAWQTVVAVAQVAVLAILVWRSLGGPLSGRFRLDALHGALGFAAGMTAVTATATLLTQMDRLVLTRMVPLEQFGYYSIAAVVGGGLTAFVNALFSTMFPMFSRLAAGRNVDELRRQYRRMWGVMTALTVPFAVAIIAFRTEVFWLWTAEAETTRVAAPLAGWLVVGAALNGAMAVVYALQLAYGATGLALRLNLLLCLLAIPVLTLLIRTDGVRGAAMAWAGLNAVYVLIGIPATARTIEVAGVLPWVGRVVIGPAVACTAVVAALRWSLPLASTSIPLALQVAGVWLAGALALVAVNRELFRDVSETVVTLLMSRRRRTVHAGVSGAGDA